MTTRGAARPALAIAVAAVMWGLWWIPVRALAERGVGGDWTGVLVFGAASAVLGAAILMRGESARIGRSALAIGLLTGGALSLWNHALVTGEVVRVTLMFYLSPVWATALGAIVLKERIGRLRVLSLGLGLGGGAIVLGVSAGLPVPRSTGEWMGLAAGASYALAATGTRLMGEVGGLAKTLASFLLGTIVAAALAAAAPSAAAPSGAEAMAALPLLLGAVAWMLPLTWLLIWGAERLDPGRVAILLLLELVTGAVSAGILADEPFGWREAAGCILILGAGLAEGFGAMARPAASGGDA